MTATRALLWLLWPRSRSLANAARSNAGRHLGRLVVFAVFGLSFMGLSFWGARWLFTQFLQAEFLAELLIRRTVDIVLLFFTGLLVFSNTITAFSTLFLADDLALLATAPVPLGRLFLARLADTWVQASWMMLVFGVPILAASGPVLGAGWVFYVAIPVTLVPLTLLCAAGGAMITLVLARVLPAQRTQEVLALLALVGFLLVYVAFRAADPERFVDPDGFGDLVNLVTNLEAGSTVLSPSTWMVDVLFALIRGDWGAALPSGLVLFTAAPAACAVAAWLARLSWRRSFTRVQEGRSQTETGRFAALARLFKRRPARYPTSPIAALVARDTRIFFRTTGQWSQLMLVLALGAVYVFNFKYFDTLQQTGILGPMGVFVAHVALGGLVITTIAVRFLYPAVSLEGRAFWAVATAPIRASMVLRAKVRWGLGPLLVVSVGLAAVADQIVEMHLAMAISAAVLSALFAYGLAGLAVGMGAMDPRFDESNPARIASGIGGVLFMLFALFYLVAVTAIMVWPVVAFDTMLEQGWWPRWDRWLKYGGLLVAGFALTAAVHHVPLRLGARRLERES
jgi:ABC-2 type transport system permease protein